MLTANRYIMFLCQHMATRPTCYYGSLGLIILKTLEALGPLHGYRIARRIEQISGDHLALNQGTLYPALLKLEQAGWIRSSWGESDSGRAVKIYTLTRAGRKHLPRLMRQPGSTRPASSRGSSRFRTKGHDRPAHLSRAPCSVSLAATLDVNGSCVPKSTRTSPKPQRNSSVRAFRPTRRAAWPSRNSEA